MQQAKKCGMEKKNTVEKQGKAAGSAGVRLGVRLMNNGITFHIGKTITYHWVPLLLINSFMYSFEKPCTLFGPDSCVSYPLLTRFDSNTHRKTICGHHKRKDASIQCDKSSPLLPEKRETSLDMEQESDLPSVSWGSAILSQHGHLSVCTGPSSNPETPFSPCLGRPFIVLRSEGILILAPAVSSLDLCLFQMCLFCSSCIDVYAWILAHWRAVLADLSNVHFVKLLRWTKMLKNSRRLIYIPGALRSFCDVCIMGSLVLFISIRRSVDQFIVWIVRGPEELWLTKCFMNAWGKHPFSSLAKQWTERLLISALLKRSRVPVRTYN